jgi:hypothetical protein
VDGRVDGTVVDEGDNVLHPHGPFMFCEAHVAEIQRAEAPVEAPPTSPRLARVGKRNWWRGHQLSQHPASDGLCDILACLQDGVQSVDGLWLCQVHADTLCRTPALEVFYPPDVTPVAPGGIFDVLAEERAYQKRTHPSPSLLHTLAVLHDYLTRLLPLVVQERTPSTNADIQHRLRKVTALGMRAMEQAGVRGRTDGHDLA